MNRRRFLAAPFALLTVPAAVAVPASVIPAPALPAVIKITITGDLPSRDFVEREIAPLLRELIDCGDIWIYGPDA